MTSDPLVHALCVVSRVIELGKRSHPSDDWLQKPIQFHVERAERHLEMLREGLSIANGA
jgi:hypothetical protein